MDKAGEVVERWRREGVRLNPGASPAKLKDLERLLGVALPQDVRGFYADADGMEDNVYDSRAVSFWSIAKIAEQKGKWPNQELGFADFMVHSWRYVFRREGAGLLVLSERVPQGRLPAPVGTFAEFLDYYLKEDFERLKF